MSDDWDTNELPLLYNGLVETAMRHLVILDACYPNAFSHHDLRLLDLFVVFGDDMDAPQGNLHVPIGGRWNAHSFRGPVIQQGLDLLVAIGHVARTDGARPKYAFDGSAVALTGFIDGPYLRRMHEVATWVGGRIEDEGKAAFMAGLFSRLLDLYSQSDAMPASQIDRFRLLDAQYGSDIERMEGLAEAAAVFQVFRKYRQAEMGHSEMPGVPVGVWFETVRQKAEAEIAKVRSQRAGLADVMREMA